MRAGARVVRRPGGGRPTAVLLAVVLAACLPWAPSGAAATGAAGTGPPGAGPPAPGIEVAALVERPGGRLAVRTATVSGQDGALALSRSWLAERAVVAAGVSPRFHTLSAATPTPPSVSAWALDAVRAPQSWSIGDAADAGGQVVAVVDTGVDLAHPRLAPVLAPGRDLVDDDDVPQDGNGHGTHVAGIIAGAAGAAGATGPRVLPVRVLDADGSGSAGDVAEGILWAVDHGATVLNLSLGGPHPSPVVEGAVSHALRNGVAVVAAAGNAGASGPAYYPAAQPGVVAVGAADASGLRAGFSSTGPHLAVTAPGVDILSTVPGGYAYASGTSMAAPFVAAALAGVRAEQPAASPARLRMLVTGTALDRGPAGFDPHHGWGGLDAYGARAAVHESTGPARVGVSRAAGGQHVLHLASQAADGGGTVRSISFGRAGDVALVGDWDGDGVRSVGVWRPSDAAFHLGGDAVNGGGSVVRVSFGNPTDRPLVGRFGADPDVDTVGVFRPATGTFHLAGANTSGGGAVRAVRFASPGDLPLAGDWNGDGTATVGVFRPSQGRFHLAGANVDGGGAVTVVDFASAGDLPLAGDWTGDHRTDVGVFRPSTGRFHLAGSTAAGGGPVTSMRFGTPADRPLAHVP